MDPIFLTSEDIDNLCDECKKDTTNGKLAYIALISYLPSLEDAKKYFKENIETTTDSYIKWKLLLWLSIIVCIFFWKRIPVYHVLFWVNLLFPTISFFATRYYKNLILIYSKGYEKVSSQVLRIKKVLKSLKVNINS